MEFRAATGLRGARRLAAERRPPGRLFHI